MNVSLDRYDGFIYPFKGKRDPLLLSAWQRSRYIDELLQQRYSLIALVDLDSDRYDSIVTTLASFPESGSYSENLARLLRYVHPNDIDARAGKLTPQNLTDLFEKTLSPLVLEFRLRKGDCYRWVRGEIAPCDDYGNGEHHVMVTIKNIAVQHGRVEINQALLAALRNLYFSMYLCGIDDAEFQYINSIEDLYVAEDCDMVPHGELMETVHRVVVPSSREGLGEFLDLGTLRDRLGDHSLISYEYQRFDRGWCRLDVVPIRWDDQGRLTHVLFAQASIHETKKREQALVSMRAQLAAERDLGREMEYRAEHDELTGLLNRTGMNRVLSDSVAPDEPLGFMLVDVDNFKTINDTYGHQIGDAVLKKVARLLQQGFRSKDDVVRFGGDEFGLLINGFDGSHGDIVVEKIRAVNECLLAPDDGLPQVSLSVGVAFSDRGYHSDLYRMADEALYRVKKAGRCGCHVFREDAQSHPVHQVLPPRQDKLFAETGRLHRSDVDAMMLSAQIGVWRMEIHPSGRRLLFVNRSMFPLLGVDRDYTPEECYDLWFSRVVPECREAVERCIELVVDLGHAEVTYTWDHPVLGPTLMRSGGTDDLSSDEGTCIFGYHQNVANVKSLSAK